MISIIDDNRSFREAVGSLVRSIGYDAVSFASRLRIAIVAVALTLSACGYNAIPTLEEQAKARWSDVQNQYQRRADLIPNLVATVQGYAA
jgi:hypothetical protein